MLFASCHLFQGGAEFARQPVDAILNDDFRSTGPGRDQNSFGIHKPFATKLAGTVDQVRLLAARKLPISFRRRLFELF